MKADDAVVMTLRQNGELRLHCLHFIRITVDIEDFDGDDLVGPLVHTELIGPPCREHSPQAMATHRARRTLYRPSQTILSLSAHA